MCSTKLLLWKNQKDSTHYPMTLYKQDSTTDVFLGIFNFFGQAISENSSKPLVVKDFYLLKKQKCVLRNFAKLTESKLCRTRT